MSVLVGVLLAAVLVGVGAWVALEVRRTRAEVRRLRTTVREYRRIDAIEREASERMRRLGRRG